MGQHGVNTARLTALSAGALASGEFPFAEATMLPIMMLLALMPPAQAQDEVILPTEPEAPRAAPAPRHNVEDEEEVVTPRKRHRRDVDEEDDRPARRRGREPLSPPVAGLVSGAAACATLPLASVVMYFVPLANFIPCLGATVAAVGAGAAAWAVAGLLAKRRVPMGTLMLTAVGTQLAVIIPGTILSAIVTVGIFAVSMVLFLATLSSSSSAGIVFLLMGEYGALGAMAVCGGLTTLLAWTATASVLGVLVSMLGRPLDPGEDALNLDGFSVPESEDEDLDVQD
jgi:hypothetical protein